MTIFCCLRLQGPRLPRLLAFLAALPLAAFPPIACAGEPQEQLSLRVHTGTVHTVIPSPDGKWLYSASEDGTVKVWDAPKGKLSQTLTVKGVSAVALSPDGKILVTGDKNGVMRLWDLETAREVRSIAGPKREIGCLAFHPSGQLLASCNFEGHAAILWDPATGAEKARVSWEDGNAWAVAFSPDGRTLAIGGTGETILWDVDTRANVASLKNRCGAAVVAFAPDGKTLAVGTFVDGIQLWDLTTNKKTGSLGRQAEEWVRSVAFAVDGKALASVGRESGSKLWVVPDCKERAAFSKDEKVASVVFTSDGKGVITGSRDGIVKVWKLTE